MLDSNETLSRYRIVDFLRAKSGELSHLQLHPLFHTKTLTKCELAPFACAGEVHVEWAALASDWQRKLCRPTIR